MAGDPLLDHLEKTFADAYRKEIDKEENVWRSLPFFAATLALQLAALAQIREWVTDVAGFTLIVAVVLLALAVLATLAAILFLGLSVWPADFQYVGREPAFETMPRRCGPKLGSLIPEIRLKRLRTVKAALAEQYATAADSNRAINQRRAMWRTRAGLATLASVFAVLVLVALVVITNIHGHARRSNSNGNVLAPAYVGNARPPPP